MTRWLNQLQPWGLFFVRVVLGIAMVYSGWPKIIPASGWRGNHLAAVDHFAHYVHTLGLPAWFGYVSAFTEFLGGIFLIMGVLTRLCALLVTINMLVAIGWINLQHGYSASAYPLSLAVMAFLLLLTGPGKLAVDRKLGLS